MSAQNPEQTGFVITGEADSATLQRVEQLLIEAGVAAHVEVQGAISPSILLERIETVVDTSELAVTEDSIEQYLLSEGMQKGAAARESRHYIAGLLYHLDEGHSGESLVCECPLDGVLEYKYSWITYAGLRPGSFVGFTAQPLETMQQQLTQWHHKLYPFGRKRLEQMRIMGQRLAGDLGIEVDNKV